MLKVHAMARTEANDPLQMFKFRVSISGLPSQMGFQKVSGLEREVGVVEYDESGFEATHKLVGKEVVGEVTLERGMFATKEFEDIFKRTLKDPDFRSVMTIELLDKRGAVTRKWTLAEAWVSKWEGPDFDATSEDVGIETITVQFEHFID